MTDKLTETVERLAKEHYERVRERVGVKPDGSWVMPEWDDVGPEHQANNRDDIRAIIAALTLAGEDDGARDKVKSIINQHVAECFRLKGPLHPGPAADAILAALSRPNVDEMREENK